MDDYRKAQKGNHNYARKFAKSGERRAVFQRDTDEEVEDQMLGLQAPLDETRTDDELAKRREFPQMLPRETSIAMLDGRQRAMANDIYLAENQRWQMYRLLMDNLYIVEYVNRDDSIRKDVNKTAFQMFLDEVHEAFVMIPEFREATFWIGPIDVKRKGVSLRLVVKKKIVEHLNNRGARIKWIA